MKRFYALAPLALALSVFGCQTEQATGEPFTTSLLSTEQAITSDRTVLLIVADDANTPEAAQIRAQLLQSIRQSLLQEIDLRWGSCGSNDPAQWHLGDMRIVFARPSAPDDEALLTSIDLPNLAWITNSSKADEIEAILDAAMVGLEKRLAMPGETYRPLHAATRAVDLLTGARNPENDAEKSFMATLPKGFLVQVVVANTRADEDKLPTDQLVPAPSTNADVGVIGYSVIGPSAGGDAYCNVYPLGTSRLESWSKSTNANFIAWPCNNQDTLDHVIERLWADCFRGCQDRPIVTNAEGSAQCKIFIDQPDLERCDADHGWRDPDGQPKFVEKYGEQYRQCEIVQHTGDNLRACRESLECANCGSGFCVTNVPEILDTATCETGQTPWPIRYTGGAIAAYDGRLHIYCETGR